MPISVFRYKDAHKTRHRRPQLAQKKISKGEEAKTCYLNPSLLPPVHLHPEEKEEVGRNVSV